MADNAMWLALLVATLRAATPLILAGLGELVAERSGVLNLGVEGMMLVGAAVGFITTATTGSIALGLLAAAGAGALLALLFGVLALSLLANQVAAGLALTILGVGLSALMGEAYVGIPVRGLTATLWPGLAQAPAWIQHLQMIDPLVVLALVAPGLVWWFLLPSRAGLQLRAIGENADVAHALGYHVLRVRYGAVLFGGAMAGLGGGFLSLDDTPMWTENMVAGRGWIALALVVFATWKPSRLAAGAWLFGFITIAQFNGSHWGLKLAPPLLATLPYLATILVLVLISRNDIRLKLNAPAALGKPFHASG